MFEFICELDHVPRGRNRTQTLACCSLAGVVLNSKNLSDVCVPHSPTEILWAAPYKVSPVALVFSLFFRSDAPQALGSKASIRVLWVAVHWLSQGLVKFVNCIEGCHVFAGGRGAVNYSLSLEMQKTAEAREWCYVGHFLLSHPRTDSHREKERERESA